MNRVKFLKLVSIFFLCIRAIFIIIFSLRNLVSKYHKILKLLFSTYESIVVAKFSRVAVFAMFHVILITLFLIRSKPSSAEDFDDLFFLPSLPPPVVHEGYRTEKEKEKNEDYDYDYYIASHEDDEHDDYHGYDGCDEGNDDDLDEEDVDSEDEITDNDLEKRIEEFISYVYKKWGEELLAERLLLLEVATD